MTSITIKNCYGSYTVEVEEDDINMEDMVTDLIVPAMSAVGYQKSTIDKFIRSKFND